MDVARQSWGSASSGTAIVGMQVSADCDFTGAGVIKDLGLDLVDMKVSAVMPYSPRPGAGP
jgi:hypothetical protein